MTIPIKECVAALHTSLKWLEDNRHRLHASNCYSYTPSAKCSCGLHRVLTDLRGTISDLDQPPPLNRFSNVEACEWQLQDTNEWAFGHKIRGIVRWPVAEIYFDEDRRRDPECPEDDPGYGWVWMVHGKLVQDGEVIGVTMRNRGVEGKLELAVEACEKELGLS